MAECIKSFIHTLLEVLDLVAKSSTAIFMINLCILLWIEQTSGTIKRKG